MQNRFLLWPLLALFLVATAVACDNSSTRDDAPPAEESADEAATDEADEVPESDDAEELSIVTGELTEEEQAAALRDPSLQDYRAPDEFQVLFDTTAGEFTVQVNRQWAPNGADRFYHLVRIGYFEDIAFFRVIEGFMGQFGIHGDPEISAVWRDASIPDDPVAHSNERGTITFATRGPDTRTTQLFINLGNNANLDHQGFSPFGRVIDGMDVVDSIYDGYGEGAPRGQGPDQGRIQFEGNEYLRGSFENLDYIESASIVTD